MFFAVSPTIENKIEFKIQNTKVASAKVAFDSVRILKPHAVPPPKRFFRCCQMAFWQRAVFRHGQWVQTLSRTIDTDATLPSRKRHTGTRKCMGNLATWHWGTHFPITLWHADIPRSLKTGWLRNRTGTGNRNRRNRFSRNRRWNWNRRSRFPGTEAGTGTVFSC